jgi:tRNA(fMet)-specific endonuclease VapC
VGLILDASILIAAERDAFDLDGLLAAAGDEPVALSAVTASEILYGLERATDVSVRARRQEYVEGLLRDFPVISFGLAQARMHAKIWAGLAAKGKMIGPHDLLVAATALAVGSSVATLNQKEFKRVPDLVVTPVAKWVIA